MADLPFIVVGLGNPGTKYENTRHNLGFKVIEELARRHGGSAQSKFKSVVSQITLGTTRLILVRPQTFMNLSGEAVLEAVQFHKVEVDKHLLVITDDLDLPPGNLRIRLSGGPGGHNGLRSIIELLGTEAFPRLRMGIGRHEKMASEHYVLAAIPPSEFELYTKQVKEAADAVEMAAKDGLAKAMNQYNRKSET